MRILYFAPSPTGGIAEYAHAQANALAELGHDVTVLCCPSFEAGRNEGYRRLPLLREYAQARPSPRRLSRNLHFARSILANFRTLANVVVAERFRYVLLESYFEYLSPLWAWRLNALARDGVVFGAVVHDPIRHYVVGPRWWHRWSVAKAYTFIRDAFVHESIALDTGAGGGSSKHVRTTVIPMGPFPSPPPTQSRDAARAKFGLPPAAPVLLAFGSIRDDKNLDLAIRALTALPEWHLWVVGVTISSTGRPVEFYRELASAVGVADRCHWRIAFVPGSEIGDVFAAADVVLLTYARSFRSQSGVLNTAVGYRKPVLASSGQGAMRSAVNDYALGLWVEPDDLTALTDGLRVSQAIGGRAAWDRYLFDHSWRRNAQLVAKAFAEP